jgi:hypothetical protein
VSRFRPVSHRIRAAVAAALLSTLPVRLKAQEPVAAPAESTAPDAPVAPAAQPAAVPGDTLTPAAAPVAELPVQDVSEPNVAITLRAPQNVALYVTRQVEGARSERHCAGDCELSLAPGRYRFALARALQRPVNVPGTFHLEGPDVLEARYDSALGKRVAGGIVLGAGIPAGLAMFVGGLKTYAALDEICDLEGNCHDEKLDGGARASIAIGAVIMVASAAVGGWLATRKDQAHLELRRVSANNALEQPAPARAPAPEPPAPAVKPEAQAPAPAAAAAREPVVSDLARQLGLPPPSTMATGPAPRPISEPEPESAPAPLRKIEPRVDLTTIAESRAALSRCFPEKLTARVELRIDISREGRLSGMGTSWPLAPRVEKCLQSALGRIQFEVGLPRTIRVNVAR